MTSGKKLLIGLCISIFLTSTSHAGFAQPLPIMADLVLSLEDLKSLFPVGFTAIPSYDNIFWTADKTEELNKHCSIDCVKQIWYSPEKSYLPNGYRWLTIILIQTPSLEAAERAVASLQYQFKTISTPDNFDYTAEIDWESYGLPDHSWAYSGRSFSVATSSGSVVILVTLRLYGFFDLDNMTYVVELVEIADYQVEKLELAGY